MAGSLRWTASLKFGQSADHHLALLQMECREHRLPVFSYLAGIVSRDLFPCQVALFLCENAHGCANGLPWYLIFQHLKNQAEGAAAETMACKMKGEAAHADSGTITEKSRAG
jgi:hypothetical protein